MFTLAKTNCVECVMSFAIGVSVTGAMILKFMQT